MKWIAKRTTVETLEPRQLMSIVFGLQAKNALIVFDTSNPAAVIQTLHVKGLQRRDTLRGIDYRPATGQLYGVGATDHLYTIDTATGKATVIGGSTFTPPLDHDVELDVDFNPSADRLRIVTQSRQDLRVNPNDGTVIDSDEETPGMQVDGTLTYDAGDINAGQAPGIIGIAYTNDDTDPSTPTTLFGIDADRDVLVRQGSPNGNPISANTGTLFTVGPLGIDAQNVGGFDVLTNSSGDTAYAALSTNLKQPSQLYSVNLSSGGVTPVGPIGKTKRPTLDLAAAPAGTVFYVATSKNDLVTMNTSTPSIIIASKKITGFTSKKEKIVGIDVRPATGELWGLTDAGQFYTINVDSGVVTPVGAVAAVPLTKKASYGFDFNPVVDLIRVNNSAGQNFRFDPATGAVVDFNTTTPAIDPDTGLAYVPGDVNDNATPHIVGAAYSNNVAGATPTTLYVLDSNRDVLATQGNVAATPTIPNTGQLFTVGATDINIPDQLGFDIVTTGGNDTAYAVFAPGGHGATGIYSVNLATGAMSLTGTLNKQVKGVAGFAINVGP